MQEKRAVPVWVTIGFGLLALALVGAMIYRSHQAEEQIKKDGETITFHSNNWVQANTDLQEVKQANLNLENQLATTKTEVTNLTTTLAQKEIELGDVQAALKAAKEQVAKRDARILELESQTQSLERQAADLTNSINSLSLQIEDTRSKLADARNRLNASEGDKAALEKELKRLMSEKAELERKFNDLTVLKAQVKKIKTELVVAKRLDWLRAGISTTEPKGAEKLASPAPTKKKRYDLNVEVNSDGTTRVIPPMVERPGQPGSPEKPIEMK